MLGAALGSGPIGFTVIEVLKPEGVADFGIPALGTIVLSGGADTTAALPAGVVAFSP